MATKIFQILDGKLKYNPATASEDGLMSASDKVKLDDVTTLVGDTAVSTQINNAVANKVDKVQGKDLSTNDYTTADKDKLSSIASGAEVNQNAFSNIAIGNTTIFADGKTDTLTFEAGNNVVLTPDAENDKVTIDVNAISVDMIDIICSD